MDKSNQNILAENGDCPTIEDVKFDPSDYLPRRTNRASAKAATKAISKSVKEQKGDSCKQVQASAKTELAKKQEPENSALLKVSRTARIKRKPARYNDCFVKLERCEQNPTLKTLVDSRKTKRKFTSSVGTQQINDDYNEIIIDVDSYSSLAKRKKMEKAQTNGIPGSKYEVVYAPTYAVEKWGLSHITQALPKNKQGNVAVFQGCENEKVWKVKSSSAKTRENSTRTNNGQKSLSLVVVHPKPGAKIVNSARGRESKSSILHHMITDPDTVISNNVSTAIASGGCQEFQCSGCPKTFLKTEDLVKHKREIHNCTQSMCNICAGEFRTETAFKNHKCKAKYQCDICGIVYTHSYYLAQHKQNAHNKTYPGLMCAVCCFNASSKVELDLHCCGGKPSKKSLSTGISSTVMVYPKWNIDSKIEPSTSTESPNIYVNISSNSQPGTAAKSETSSDSEGLQFLCEICLNMYSSRSDLESHKCVKPSKEKNQETDNVELKTSSNYAQSLMPLSMKILPEVEQLAKFYSSIVFKE